MLVFPAIDLLGGQVVRLYQGDYGKSQVFGSDPSAFARDFKVQGAVCLHLVDLDGARAGSPQNFSLAGDIAAQTGLFVELGGGIRSEETVEACFAAGIGRVILGTAALKDPAFTKKTVQKHGEKIAVGVDARDGRVAVEGWLETSQTDSFSFCKEMLAIGVEYLIYTDISTDGTGMGTNLPMFEKLAGLKGLSVTASGGVSAIREIEELRAMGLYAVILGKALYAGSVNLKEALGAAGVQRL